MRFKLFCRKTLILLTVISIKIILPNSASADPAIASDQAISEALASLTGDDNSAEQAIIWLQSQKLSTHHHQIELLKLLQMILPEPTIEHYEIYTELATQLGPKVSMLIYQFDHSKRYSDVALVLIDFYEHLQTFRLKLLNNEAGIDKLTSEKITPIYRAMSADLLQTIRWYTSDPDSLVNPKTGEKYVEGQLISIKTRIDDLYRAIASDVFISLDETSRERDKALAEKPSVFTPTPEKSEPAKTSDTSPDTPRLDLIAASKFLSREVNPMHLRLEILPQIVATLENSENNISVYEYEAVMEAFLSVTFQAEMTPQIIEALHRHAYLSLEKNYSETAKMDLLSRIKKLKSSLPLIPGSRDQKLMDEAIARVESVADNSSINKTTGTRGCDQIFDI